MHRATNNSGTPGRTGPLVPTDAPPPGKNTNLGGIGSKRGSSGSGLNTSEIIIQRHNGDLIVEKQRRLSMGDFPQQRVMTTTRQGSKDLRLRKKH